MSAKEEIIDYSDYSEEIEKWLARKGEIKYMRFAKILRDNNVEVKWDVLRDTYKYDKRLLVNLFKYFSFFEEFIKAQVWNFSQTGYNRLENLGFPEAMDALIAIKDDVQYKGFSINELIENKEGICNLRNRVCHNKIIIENTKGHKLVIAFKNTLPDDYKDGFISDINKCTNGLSVPSCLIINL